MLSAPPPSVTDNIAHSGVLLHLLERIYSLFCRHEWIRERRYNGKLGQRCMKCMKRREHEMLRLIEWKIDYVPIEPAYSSELPPEIHQNARRAA